MPRRGSPYGPAYERARRAVLHGDPPCWRGCGRVASEADHQPPIELHNHREPWPSSGCCELKPICDVCHREQGGLIAMSRRLAPVPDALEVAEAEEPELEVVGLGASDPVWRVPWLKGLLKVPADATWPRFMTVPHPLATGSYGAELVKRAEARSRKPLRWWQRLTSARVLEHDDAGTLLWEEWLLTLARQLGKSWWMRELALWRMDQGDRFGEPQDVVHTGKDLAVCKEVQRAARVWAKAHRDIYNVREVNGQEEIERKDDGSRWLLRAKEAVYGYAASLALVDEGWKVPAASVEEGLEPTQVEREQSQLGLISTAHRRATVLMLGRRETALRQLLDPPAAGGALILEWSARKDAPMDDPGTWREASPHWSDRRERLVAKRYVAALRGESDDPDEPDPIASFRSQWLNIWPDRQTKPSKGDELVAVAAWAELGGVSAVSSGPLTVAVEDNHGKGAAVAAAQRLRDGRLEVDGWECETWDDALAAAVGLLSSRPRSRLILGRAVMAKAPRVRPKPVQATAGDTAGGLSLLRDLVKTRQVVHDATPELDAQLETLRVKEMASGLTIVPGTRADLVRAAVWALRAAHARRRVPNIAGAPPAATA